MSMDGEYGDGDGSNPQCPECNGVGMVDCDQCGTAEAETCDNCGGSGEVDDDDSEI